ncbi:hypothetical protein CH373_14530 [Leptospira perolatii]|uniref:DUF2203 domain-containing protein n=1 Tax=Leptospira perolatii TaxID=2023191 RepID=A0A2M9ZJW6_9LEPT|nr:DUF2203 domain-containing protein [Leptospira perolatii]PJZ69252.1 hypothetical protein CH360_12090 [Leptospira perolatii]PJZ72366.1 hypothetical protein CH373_14530 [Leptospira perolatii]
MERKIWTYEEARKILPYVRSITEEFYTSVNQLHQELQEFIVPENELEQKENRLEELLVQWAEKIRGLGIEVKGLWLIDFDNGKGYYCWHLGEEDLLFEHGYDEGFAGRKPISEIREEEQEDDDEN